MAITAPRAHSVLSHEEREWALNTLHKIPRLSRLGRRLLADLVSRCPVYGFHDRQAPIVRSLAEVHPSQKGAEHVGDSVAGPILAFSVIQGVARARRNAAVPLHKQNKRRTKEGLDAHRSDELHLPIGSYGRHEGGLDAFERGKLLLEPSTTDDSDRPMRLLAVTLEAAAGSPEILHRMIAGEDSAEIKRQLEELAKPELICFDGDDAYDSVLRPMMYALAAAVARSRPNIAVVDLGQKIEAAKWTRKSGGFVPAKLVSPTEDQLRALVDHTRPGAVFVLRPCDPGKFAVAEVAKFDRVVYVTDQIPHTLPQHLRNRLRPEVFDDVWDPDHREPHFVSFLPTVAVPPRNPAPGHDRRRFEVVKISHSAMDEETTQPPRGLRPYRDACVVPVHRAALRRAWEQWLPKWEAGTQPQFLDTAVAAGALRQESTERWARALLMRRVGVALSGGGACGYRFVPVLERLQRRGVPVDVFAGLSGGALLGTFYCLRGRDGLNQYVNLGSFIQAMMPLASWSTAPFEYTTDYLLGGACVEDLEVRLAAVTVALPDEGPPYGAVVVQGTLGAAARASGTLPPAYAPTEKNGTRYADGGAATAVPARVARDCGADVVLSCNAIPGPDSCNPFPAYVFGAFLSRALRRVPLWDRMIDSETWRSFQWQQSSRAFGEEADAFLEFPPSGISIAEPGLFMLARYIIAAANTRGKDIERAIQRLTKAWSALG